METIKKISRELFAGTLFWVAIILLGAETTDEIGLWGFIIIKLSGIVLGIGAARLFDYWNKKHLLTEDYDDEDI